MGDSGALLLGFVLASSLRAGPAEDGGDGRPVLPAARAGGSDRRHDVRRRAPAEARPDASSRATRRTCTTASCAAASRSRAPRVTIWAWCLSLAAGALATRFIPIRAHGVWHLWPTVAAAAIGLVALSISIYVVYVLEIVKVGNPYHRRRAEGDPLRKRA